MLQCMTMCHARRWKHQRMPWSLRSRWMHKQSGDLGNWVLRGFDSSCAWTKEHKGMEHAWQFGRHLWKNHMQSADIADSILIWKATELSRCFWHHTLHEHLEQSNKWWIAELGFDALFEGSVVLLSFRNTVACSECMWAHSHCLHWNCAFLELCILNCSICMSPFWHLISCFATAWLCVSSSWSV